MTKRIYAACLVAAPGWLFAQATLAPTIDFTGRWSLVTGTPQDPSPASMTLAMRPDGQLSGEVGRPGMGSVAIREGRVEGTHFTLSFVIGTGQAIRYEGTVTNDTLRGRWTYEQ